MAYFPRPLVAALWWLTCLVGYLSAAPTFADRAQLKRSAAELQGSYDYVVVGGGTSGLVVANRLSEDSSKSVLVVELGYIADEACIWQPKSIERSACVKHRFNITGIPQPEINNQTWPFPLGAVVGGSSAVNGMVFDRGARIDYNAWEELGNPGWGWEGLFQYFKKSTTFDVPSQQEKEKFGWTWDKAAYGDGPIHASFPAFQWSTQNISMAAWKEMGLPTPKEHAFGDAIGLFFVPSSEHGVNRTRSYARYGYHDPAASRLNYHLLVGHKAEKLVLSTDKAAEGVVIYQRDNPQEKFTIKVAKEVILTAGAVHTPQILELSGVGPRDVLEAAKIDVKLELPGVGNNFQDHPQAYLTCNFTQDVWPNPATLTNNATFLAAAQAEYDAHKTGPLTLNLNTGFTFLPLGTIHSQSTGFHERLAAQHPDTYLPRNLDSSVRKGYKVQKNLLARLYRSPESSVFESPFGGVCQRTSVLTKPLSRGQVHINASDPYGPPIIDFRVYSNPLDMEVSVESIKYTRKYFKSELFAPLKPVESAPGPNVTDDMGIEAHIRRTGGPSSFHVSGTAAMMPLELGGVVGPDLKVYGLKGVSVADASIQPLIPGAHLSATVYAVAEKAADIIKSRG
ncbi:GMC oxidoreductase [Periconia macrospinosa]|uniref:GMC oxidoreductase n=1 Tax=Periconia macrospinosa TaxID=97972 RepID=A0A2V1DFX6_9PLEO|nr:GMC oxidoreductase [Periconia macrospinosa]